MERLRACYPQRNEDPKRWATSVRVYWEALAGYDAGVVERALAEAPRAHPHWFPTLGQALELCKKAERDLKKPPPRPTPPPCDVPMPPDTPDPWGPLHPRPWPRWGQLMFRVAEARERRKDPDQRDLDALAEVRAELGLVSDDAAGVVDALTGGRR